MSAGGLARLGVRCADASTGIATIGVFCGDITEIDERGSGSGAKSRRQAPYGITPNRALAMREDEEFVAVLMALLNSRHRN